MRLAICLALTRFFGALAVNAHRGSFPAQPKVAGVADFDPTTFYKPNCEECHGSAAEKRFNPDNPEGQMIDAILNGAKAEGSKDMPAFKQKGIDEARARALIAYMKSIKE